MPSSFFVFAFPSPYSSSGRCLEHLICLLVYNDKEIGRHLIILCIYYVILLFCFSAFNANKLCKTAPCFIFLFVLGMVSVWDMFKVLSMIKVQYCAEMGFCECVCVCVLDDKFLNPIPQKSSFFKNIKKYSRLPNICLTLGSPTPAAILWNIVPNCYSLIHSRQYPQLQCKWANTDRDSLFFPKTGGAD